MSLVPISVDVQTPKKTTRKNWIHRFAVTDMRVGEIALVNCMGLVEFSDKVQIIC